MPTACFAPAKCVCLVATLCLFAGASSEGAEKRWAALAGGSWQRSSNWENNSPPGAADEARFIWSPSGDVTFEANAATDRLWVGDSFNAPQVTFDLNLNTYTTRRAVFVWDVRPAFVTVRDGRLRATESIYIDMSSRLTVEDGGTVETASYSSGDFGGTGGFRTTTRIDSGGTLTADELDASGSGFSLIDVLTGGTLNTSDAELGSGYSTPSGGPDTPYSLIDVDGGTWNSDGDIRIVGSWNSVTDYARLTVENGGRLFSSGDLSTTSEGQIYLLEEGLISTNSLTCASGTLTLLGGDLLLDAADPAESQEHPGQFSIGSSTLNLGGPDRPVIHFKNGAFDAALSRINVGTAAGAGTFRLESGSKLTTTSAAVGASNDGTVHIAGAGSEWTNSGNVSLFFSGASEGSLAIVAGGKLTTGTLSCPNPNVVDLQEGGTLVANRIANSFLFDAGTLSVDEIDGALAQSGGAFQPGTPYGAADISGYYNVSNGAIAMELAGTTRGVDYDCLDVGGAFTIGNVDLAVTLANGFVPQPGQTFDLFETGSVSGGFAEVALPSLPNGGTWIVDELASAGVIRVNHPPTGTALAPATVECVDGAHSVELTTTVGDGDGGLLDVAWSIRGPGSGTWNLIENDAAVPSGDVASLVHDFPHGVTHVRAEIRDVYQTVYVETTVTVQDTAAPIVIVAADRTVPTDPGESFATNVVLAPPDASDASGHPVSLESDAPVTFSLGDTIVTWTATDDDGNQATAEQKVTVVDQERPTILPGDHVRTFCDPGKLFATVRLAPPEVFDNVPEGTTITNDVGRRFRIGATNVVWTATDRAGNESRWKQRVIVVNRKPKAVAGKNITIVTKSERGARVALDGSRSFDPDEHKLKYAWRTARVRLRGAAKASGFFPVGTKTVKLTVTDAGGLKHTDAVKVTVKLKDGRPRSRGADANRSFAAASQQAASALRANASGGSSLSGLAYANAASAFGDAAGEFVRWEEGQSEADALLSYAELRAMQAAYGEAAADALLSAYAETGDESLLSAYGYAAFGTAYAAADLGER